MMLSIPRRLLPLARRHGAAMLVLASVVWVVASLLVAIRHGAHRRKAFNGVAESGSLHASAPTNR